MVHKNAIEGEEEKSRVKEIYLYKRSTKDDGPRRLYFQSIRPHLNTV